MSVGFKRNSNPHGSHMVICDRSGFQINSTDAVKERRTGMIVYKDFVQDWTPLDFPPRIVPERIIKDARPEGASSYYAQRLYTDANGNLFASSKISPTDTRFTASSSAITALEPSIADQTFYVFGTPANQQSVGTVSASDPNDDTLTYSITDGNDDSIFTINPSTGEITIIDASLIDTGTDDELTVTVTDDSASQLTDSATITIDYQTLESYYSVLSPDAYWKLDEGSGSTATDASGDIDLSIVGAGTLAGSAIIPSSDDASFDNPGGAGEGLSTDSQDYIPSGMENFSATAWFILDTLTPGSGTFQTVMGASAPVGDSGAYFSIDINSTGTLVARFYNTGLSSQATVQTSSALIEIDTLYNVTVTFNAGTVVIYINAVDVTGTITGTVPATATFDNEARSDNKFSIGALPSTTPIGRGFNGRISHAGLWESTTLSAAQVENLYAAGVTT
jgi:hypothetical protein